MLASRLSSGLALACVVWVGGCAMRPAPTPRSMPPSPEAVEEMRGAYKQAYPNARVGVVVAVLDSGPYALVGDIDTAGIADGAAVTFLDAAQAPIAHGDVEKVDAAGLTVRFTAGQRPPVVGDAAVKF